MYIYFAPSFVVNKHYTINTTNKVKVFLQSVLETMARVGLGDHSP